MVGGGFATSLCQVFMYMMLIGIARLLIYDICAELLQLYRAVSYVCEDYVDLFESFDTCVAINRVLQCDITCGIWESDV